MTAVHEYSVPAAAAVPPDRGTSDYVFDNAGTRPDHVALRRKSADGWEDVTTSGFAIEVGDLARGLIAAGIAAGDRIGLMSRTRYEWTVADFAILAIGAVTVPIYETSSAEQVQWILADSEAVACFVDSDAHAAIVDQIRPECQDLRDVWVFESGGIATLVDSGGDVPIAALNERRSAVHAADLASIIYTSGTTGRPKGCELTHANFMSEVDQISGGLAELFNTRASTLLFIPIAHVFGRAIQMGAIASGTTLGHTADITTLVPDLAGFQPKFVLSVPRVFEKVYNTAKQRAHGDGKGKIFDAAAHTAIEYSKALEQGSIGLTLRVRHALFDRLVYGKLRAALGGRCEAAISGGAPLGERLGHFYRGIGVTIYEGYGLTESTAGACVNLQNAVKIGTVGRPIPGMTVRITEDGELLMRGAVVFRGYWKNDGATREAIDADGWFHTGDLGDIDDDGFVRITGRKKEIIVTAAGKNVAPAVLEDRLRAHWLISQCLVVGDQQPFIGALVTIDAESLPTFLRQHDRPADTPLESLVDDDALRAEIQHAVDDANKAVSKAESIRKFAIVARDWTEDGGQMTPSLKLKRNVVLEEHSGDIEALYADVNHI